MFQLVEPVLVTSIHSLSILIGSPPGGRFGNGPPSVSTFILLAFDLRSCVSTPTNAGNGKSAAFIGSFALNPPKHTGAVMVLAVPGFGSQPTCQPTVALARVNL